MSTDLGIDLIFENDETWDFLNIEINSSGELGQDGEKHLDSSTPSSEMAPLPPPGERVSSDKEGMQMQMMKKNEKEGEGKREASEQEKIHIFTERERRKKMRTMFTNLHALLPQLPTKVSTYVSLSLSLSPRVCVCVCVCVCVISYIYVSS